MYFIALLFTLVQAGTDVRMNACDVYALPWLKGKGEGGEREREREIEIEKEAGEEFWEEIMRICR